MSALPFVSTRVAYVDGEYVSAESASVSVFDRGLLYGDGIYETLLARDGRVFRLDRHLERLSASAMGIRLSLPVSREHLREIVLETVRRNELLDAYIRIVVTRGAGYPNLDPRAVATPPTLIVFAHGREQPTTVSGSYSRSGIALRVVSIRKTPSVCLAPQVKSLNYLNQVLARLEALDTGAGEGLLLDMQGLVAEGAGDNIFAVRDGTLVTPPLDSILPGITRQAVIELAGAAGRPVVERAMTVHDLLTANEVFLCSTYGGILPVVTVNGCTIGNGAPGDVTEFLHEAYEQLLVEEAIPPKA
jgi:branched-chain amino acid aminotransferase